MKAEIKYILLFFVGLIITASSILLGGLRDKPIMALGMFGGVGIQMFSIGRIQMLIYEKEQTKGGGDEN